MLCTLLCSGVHLDSPFTALTEAVQKFAGAAGA